MPFRSRSSLLSLQIYSQSTNYNKLIYLELPHFFYTQAIESQQNNITKENTGGEKKFKFPDFKDIQ